MTDKTKTHWLQNPNKNYLGHWDLPEGRDIILTIKSAQWEEVKNPIIKTSEAKRVIRFEEAFKPFICNETNSQSIMRSTGQSYMEDCKGFKIKLFLSQVKVKGEQVDCLRAKEVPQSELQVKSITTPQQDEILNLLPASGMKVKAICDIMKIQKLSELPATKFKKLVTRLKEKGAENANT